MSADTRLRNRLIGWRSLASGSFGAALVLPRKFNTERFSQHDIPNLQEKRSKYINIATAETDVMAVDKVLETLPFQTSRSKFGPRDNFKRAWRERRQGSGDPTSSVEETDSAAASGLKLLPPGR